MSTAHALRRQRRQENARSAGGRLTDLVIPGGLAPAPLLGPEWMFSNSADLRAHACVV